ncbi:MAG: rhodanese-like domain-containing protein [Candidatus Scalindua sp.]|jgi:rhodanese-related sulfurtransferase|nr:rhodanese-like domain-containing protein [Candidatus Scalindua sp.]MDV5167089.1 rhodanese-like domain-containing protein [Candidatus Scalindua sp.]
MVKFLQLVLVMMFLIFAMPQTFSQEQAKPKCSFCELKAEGAEKCEKCLSSEKCQDCLSKEKGKCPLPGKKSDCSKSSKEELCRKYKNGPYINTTVLENIIESGIPMVLLDARSGKWDGKSRIPGALSLNDKSTKDEVAGIIESKDALVITYCSSLKCGASNKLYIHLKKLGYKNVLEYPFGIKGWLESGNDIEMDE